MNAAKTLFMFKVFSDGGMCKVINFIEHPHGRVDNGICTDGPRSFSQTQPQIQQRTGMQGVEYQFVARLVSAVSEDGVNRQFRVEPGGGKQAEGHDEAVNNDTLLQRGSLQHGAYGHYHFQSTKVADDVPGRAVAFVILHRLFQHFVFVADARAVESAACADTLFQRNDGKAGHPQGG